MRIAFVAVKGIPVGGGIEKLTEVIGSKLTEKGHDVVVYSSRDYGTSDGYFKGMLVRTVPSLNAKSLHKLSICFHAIHNVLLHDNVDLVHIHAVGPSIFAIFPRLKGIPTVVQTHGLEWKRDKWGFVGKSFFRLADFTALYFPHKTTSVSMVQKDYYESKFSREVIHIPTGINNVQKQKPSWILRKNLEPNHYILFAARLVPEKGAHYLIEAFRSLQTDMKLVIAGDAAHSQKYIESLKQSAAGDSRILFTGFVSGRPLEELFSNAYLFCLPSTMEGLPIALLEAMSYGNCCVASDIPENVEAMETYGYTFRNRNPESLHQLLADLISNPTKVEVKKETARSYVLANYSWDAITERMEALYISVLEDRNR